MGYWPSNLLILAGLLFPVISIFEQEVMFLSDLRLLVVGLAYHHLQQHFIESTGERPPADRMRLVVAFAACCAAGAFMWIS